MKKKLINSLLFFIILLAGCKKIDLEDPIDGSPVFSVNLEFSGGEILHWEAGIDSLYMFTDFEKDENGVYQFFGKMEKENCAPVCEESLTIIFRDAQQLNLGLPNINNAIFAEQYPYYNQQLILFDTIIAFDTFFIYQVAFEVDTSITNFNDFTNYEWYDGTFIFSNELSISETYDLFPNGDFMLRVNDLSPGDSCVVWQRQLLQENPDNKSAVYLKPQYNADSILESLEAVPVFDNGPFIFSWNNGSSSTSISAPFEAGVEYIVSVTDANGNTSSAGFIYSGLSNISQNPKCSAHFNYDIFPIPSFIDTNSTIISVVDSLQFSAVTVIYKDEYGNEFRSDGGEQDANANFRIITVADYDENEKGYPTKKIELEFNCILWSENQAINNITNGNAVWGIAYPN